jgi:uncharacterized protein YukE
MASTVINNPESIRDYRVKIEKVVERLKEQLAGTETAIERVSQDWKDEVFQNFRKEFNADKEKIKPLCDILTKYDTEVLDNLQKKLLAYLDSSTHL